MAENTPKRKIRDSVFTNLFQEKKYLLQLYKATGLAEVFRGVTAFLRRCYGDTYCKGKISEPVPRLVFCIGIHGQDEHAEKAARLRDYAFQRGGRNNICGMG